MGTEAPTGIGIDSANNIYLSRTALDFNQNDPRLAVTQFLTSWTSNGTVRWSRTMISHAQSRRATMDVDPDGNVYIAASFVGEKVTIDRGDSLEEISTEAGEHIIVLKYDAQGMLQWYQTATGSDSITADGIAATPLGIWLAGTFTRSVALGQTHLNSSGGSDLFVARLSPDGTFRLAVRSGGASTDLCHGLAADLVGNAVLLAEFEGTASFGQRTLQATGPSSFVLAHYIIDGTVNCGPVEGGPSLSPAWMFTAKPLLLHLDRRGNTYLGISYFDRISIGDSTYQAASECDALAVKYDVNGVLAWIHSYSGLEQQLVQGMATDIDGNLYVAGFSQALPEGQVYVTKLSPDGKVVWQVTNDLGDALGDAEGGPLCVDTTGNIYVSGGFDGQTRFGTHRLKSVGSTDSSISGMDVYIATLGSASGVPDDKDRGTIHQPATLWQRDGALLLTSSPGSPTIIDASLYSSLGKRVTSLIRRSDRSASETLRLDIGGVASGAYFVVAHTAEGVACYPVMISR
jgi:hypothetical protein